MIVFVPYTVNESEVTTNATITYDSTYFDSSWKGAWIDGSYAEDDVVYHATTLHLYQSLASSNTDDPTDDTIDPATWLDLGYVNPMRMFDNTYVGESHLAVTTSISPLEVVLTTDNVSHIGLFNVTSDIVTIELLNADDEVQSSVEYNLLDDSLGIEDWYDYFFAPYQTVVRDIVLELDFITSYNLGDKLKITMESDGLPVSCSNCFVGYGVNMGGTRWEPTISAYSTGGPSTDDMGRTKFVSGESYKNIKATINIENSTNYFPFKFLSSLQNTPAVYDFNNPGTNYDLLRSYASITSIGLVIPGPNYTKIDVEITGIVKKIEV